MKIVINPLTGNIEYVTSNSDELTEGSTNLFNQITDEEGRASIHDSVMYQGQIQNHNAYGYYTDKIVEKLLHRLVLGWSNGTDAGGMRFTNDTPQIYVSGWKDILYGINIDAENNNILNFNPLDTIFHIDTHSGDSEEVGLNGRPLVQSYVNVYQGPYPPTESIYGGSF